MPAFELERCARPNILALQPYRCARDDYVDDGTRILLDANENSLGPALAEGDSADPLPLHSLHRYPDPHQRPLKQLFCDLRNTPAYTHTSKSLTPANVFLGVGSDEAIDAIIRCFCVPARDRILICPPTYGMYSVAAQINDVGLFQVPLVRGWQLDVPAIQAALTHAENRIKVAWFCSPGNPTGAVLRHADLLSLLSHPTWNGIMVLDEAYIDFAASPTASLAALVPHHPNLVVLQTLSKAFGLAGLRLGAAFASVPVAHLLNALKAPYNISRLTETVAARALSPPALALMRASRDSCFSQRARLVELLPALPGMGRVVGGLDANFVLVQVLDRPAGTADNAAAMRLYQSLADTHGLVVRFRGNEIGCTGCLRITVGTEEENTKLVDALRRALRELQA